MNRLLLLLVPFLSGCMGQLETEPILPSLEELPDPQTAIEGTWVHSSRVGQLTIEVWNETQPHKCDEPDPGYLIIDKPTYDRVCWLPDRPACFLHGTVYILEGLTPAWENAFDQLIAHETIHWVQECSGYGPDNNHAQTDVWCTGLHCVLGKILSRNPSTRSDTVFDRK